MANYLDQIPKQLAARRKAFAAARDNPALLPSCWAIVRSIANNMYEYMRNSVIGGCTFPDRPAYLSVDDAAFLNFGATPNLLMHDRSWTEAEADKQPAPEDFVLPSPDGQTVVRRSLARLARLFGRNHHASRLYNLEPWLQDQYRDRLDVDFAEDLQRQIDALNVFMDGVPKALAASGLSARLAKGVMDAFNLFKTITGSSHQLDREKMSFVDRRSYVNTLQKIELIMVKADESLGAATSGRSVVRELFELWKESNYEMMELTRQLRVLWAGTSLDDRIAELADLLAAFQKTMNRCTEEARIPKPQLPVFLEEEAAPDAFTREDVAGAFQEIGLYNIIAGADRLLCVREIRKFGPLAVVITPGAGQPRYCAEIRKLRAAEDEDSRRKTKFPSGEREMDVDRRVRYPLNCLLVPVGAAKGSLFVDLADAWLEYNHAAFPIQYKEFLEAAKSASPEAFQPPADREVKELPPTYGRLMLARLCAAFVRWAHNGEEPNEEETPGFPPFRELALSRLDPKAYLVPERYRPLALLFSEAGVRRRQEMWKRCLGPRFPLDRQLVAVSVLRKDWEGLRDHLKLLPLSQTKGNANLDNGFARARDAGDPFGEHKAMGFFRKFLTEQPDLKAALVAVESQVSIEVETLRSQSESLGKTFQYDAASENMMNRQASQIQEKRMAANRHIDHYLTGLMYSLDGNYEAAESALAMALTPINDRETDDLPMDPVPGEIGQEWFDAHLQPREGKFEKRRVPGENGNGTVCFDYIYYNLGLVYLRMDRLTEARMAFQGCLESAEPETSHLYRQWAAGHIEAIRAKTGTTSRENGKER